MKIIVNGAETDSAATTLAGLLEERGQADAAVATAVNEDFVPRAQRAAQPLAAGDRVEIVAPRQGG